MFWVADMILEEAWAVELEWAHSVTIIPYEKTLCS